jgi:hypothetical protein
VRKQQWIDVDELKRRLGDFFQESGRDVGRFGRTVNQVFEAFVFAQVLVWHRAHGWQVSVQNPPPEKRRESDGIAAHTPEGVVLKLKFSTRGQPSKYSYGLCVRNGESRQVRHNLRVATASAAKYRVVRANMVVDVAVIRDIPLKDYRTDDPIPNAELISFGEAKHMSAYAELVASFLGIVGELQPSRLRQRVYSRLKGTDLIPFLFVSGHLNGTGEGIVKTIKRRGYAVDVYSRVWQLRDDVKLPTCDPRRAEDV